MRIGEDVETVRVPHTWNVGKHADYEGTARYSRTFAIPAGAAGKHVELHFDATFYQSRVMLNGMIEFSRTTKVVVSKPRYEFANVNHSCGITP